MSIQHNLPRTLEKNSGLFNDISHSIEQRVVEALDKVFQQHNIDPSSDVGVLLRNGLRKLLIGMHHLHDAISDLDKVLPKDSKLNSKSSIKRLFYNDFLKACQKSNAEHPNEVERILLIEMGRTKVIANILFKMQDLTGKELRNGYKILGSLVRQAIDIYRELGGAEFNISKNPVAHRREIEEILGKKAGKMLTRKETKTSQAPALQKVA